MGGKKTAYPRVKSVSLSVVALHGLGPVGGPLLLHSLVVLSPPPIAHHSGMVAVQEAMLYNKTKFLSEVELVWFGKGEGFSFEM